MGVLEMIAWLLAGLTAIVGLCFLVIWLERKFPGEQYDERQQAARGKAYRLGFCVGVVCFFISILYITFGGNMDGMILVLFLGFEVQALVFHTYCLLNHAALPLSQKPMPTILGYGAMAAMNGVNAFLAFGMDGRWPDKPPVNTVQQLSMAVAFGALAIMHLIQYLRDKKE